MIPAPKGRFEVLIGLLPVKGGDLVATVAFAVRLFAPHRDGPGQMGGSLHQTRMET